jgi:acyl-CoA reductase-like NAD-dependent aldehyde dehydrogenase
MSSNTKALRSSVVDGIALVPRYRERQLSALHRALSSAKEDLLDVTTTTFAFTRNEALAEYFQTLNAVKSFHAQCEPQSCNDTEYAIINSKDYADRRTPHGYAYIVPANDSLYNTIVPLAAAIAAGNIVALQRPSRKASVASRLESILPKALSVETFAYVDRDPFDPKFQQSRGVVFEGQSSTSATTTTRRICSSRGRVVAIVDRSSHVKQAAKDLVQARFSLGGSATYAPDLVLVNEFRLKDFSEAVAEAGLRYLSRSVDSASAQNVKVRQAAGSDASFEKDGTILMSGSEGKVVLLKSRDSGLIYQKLNSAVLLLLPISSMDDAIDLLNSEELPLSANYVYASPPAAKYITQFVRSEVSFVNHIPADLLIGGAGPNGWQLSVHPRYTPEMFSQPSPVLINSTSRSEAVASLVSLSSSRQQKKFEKALDATLTPIKEPFGPTIGFFEQGFLFNATLILSSIVVGTFCGIKYGYPALASAL